MANESPLRLPNAETAVVSEAKIREYLLSTTHPIGRFKAAFFGGLGYTVEHWVLLQQAFLQLARSGEVVLEQKSLHGQKYEVHGTLESPSGRRAGVITVWIIRNGETAPQLVTAFPGESL